jgi:hypothetical protein
MSRRRSVVVFLVLVAAACAGHVAPRPPDDTTYRDGNAFRTAAMWLVRHADLGLPPSDIY